MILWIFLAVLLADLLFVDRIADLRRRFRVKLGVFFVLLGLAAVYVYQHTTIRHVDDGRDDIHIVIKRSP